MGCGASWQLCRALAGSLSVSPVAVGGFSGLSDTSDTPPPRPRKSPKKQKKQERKGVSSSGEKINSMFLFFRCILYFVDDMTQISLHFYVCLRLYRSRLQRVPWSVRFLIGVMTVRRASTFIFCSSGRPVVPLAGRFFGRAPSWWFFPATWSSAS